jgi:hypothetical protein
VSVKESSHRLHELICPHSFRPHWYVNLGIAEFHGTGTDFVVLYTDTGKIAQREAKKFLDKHCTKVDEDYVWEGFRVKVTPSGHARLL